MICVRKANWMAIIHHEIDRNKAITHLVIRGEWGKMSQWVN